MHFQFSDSNKWNYRSSIMVAHWFQSKKEVIRKLIVQENKIENVYWSTTVKIVTSTQFPIKDFLFPRKYKRTLREHQMSNWSHIFIRCHREMKVSSAGSFGGHSPAYLLMKPSNTSNTAPKCQKISNLWRRGGEGGFMDVYAALVVGKIYYCNA